MNTNHAIQRGARLSLLDCFLAPTHARKVGRQDARAGELTAGDTPPLAERIESSAGSDAIDMVLLMELRPASTAIPRSFCAS